MNFNLVKGYFKEVKRIIQLDRREKKLILKYFIIQFFQILVENILPLFLTFCIYFFDIFRPISIICLFIFLLSDVIQKVINSIFENLENKILNTFNIKQLKFSVDVLNKTRGKVYREKDGIVKLVSPNNIIKISEQYYIYLYNIIRFFLQTVFYIFTYIITFIGIYKTVPKENIISFTIALCIYGILYLIALKVTSKKILINSKKSNENILAEIDRLKDLENITPINKKHSNFLLDSYVEIKKEENDVTESNIKLRNVKKIVFSGMETILIFYIVITTIRIGTDNLSVDKILLSISIANVLKSLITNISGFLDAIKDIKVNISEYLLNKNEFDLIYKEYNTINEEEYQKDVIVVDKLDFKYPGTNFRIISETPIMLKRGKITLINGNSGSGKSTFIKLVTGEIGNYQKQKIKSLTYFNDRSELGSGNVLNEIIFDLEVKEIDNKLQEILEGLKLNDKINNNTINKSFKEFVSNGMKQRILLARLLYNLDDSDLVCIDEPIGSLDEKKC